MPTLLVVRGFAFRFRAVDRREPPHVHVSGNDGQMKVWLQTLEVEQVAGYTRRRIREAVGIAAEHREEWLDRWYEFFA